MARESFDDEAVAALLNAGFISIKVDREERPDLDSVYMNVCQAMTGGGGWPMSLFLTPEKKPFFAGTYFPKDSQRGMMGFLPLLKVISQKWIEDRDALLESAKNLIAFFSQQAAQNGSIDPTLLDEAIRQFRQSFDEEYGGFGQAPKFPTPHNLLFLMDQTQKSGDSFALHMVEITLRQMYHGGLFDHIGYGFSRYSTDRAFQVPHFEKMLYDNALLMMSYVKAYQVTNHAFYLEVAIQTADYVLREMTSPEGAFYSAQDADSEGVEGRYYTFTPSEIEQILGTEIGDSFNRCYGITEKGNFEGRSIPHLVGSLADAHTQLGSLPALRAYRKQRSKLHLDDKILTAWNALMIAALAQLSRVSGEDQYLQAALGCLNFLRTNLLVNDRLFVSYRDGTRSGLGYLDDYACVAFALLELYQATQNANLLEQAQQLCRHVISNFLDTEQGGFFLSGAENETLIFRPKETYDGAIPSGNSLMAHNLVRLSQLTADLYWEDHAKRQLEFLSGQAKSVPMGYAFFLLALSAYLKPPDHVVVVLAATADKTGILKELPLDSLIAVMDQPTKEYQLLNGRTTYYVCKGHTCLPPTNDPPNVQRS